MNSCVAFIHEEKLQLLYSAPKCFWDAKKTVILHSKHKNAYFKQNNWEFIGLSDIL